MSRPFEVVQGGREKLTVACTFCAGMFPDRADLERHWEFDARCKAGRFVSNGTQSKYLDADAERIVPGEHTLRLVKENTKPSAE